MMRSNPRRYHARVSLRWLANALYREVRMWLHWTMRVARDYRRPVICRNDVLTRELATENQGCRSGFKKPRFFRFKKY